MFVTIFAHPSEKAIAELSTATMKAFKEGVSSINKTEETTIAIFEIKNKEITEDQFMKCVESVIWDRPEHVYIVIKNNDKEGLNTFKGNKNYEFTRVFRNNIVVNMFT